MTIVLLTFLAVALAAIGLLLAVERPLSAVAATFRDRSRYFDPASAMLIALGAYGTALEEEQAELLGVSGSAHSLLGISKAQYDRGIQRIGMIAGSIAIVGFLALSDMSAIVCVLAGAFVGLITALLMNFVMKDMAIRRSEAQVQQFPFFLDIFLLTVQSNGTIEDAIESYTNIFGNNEISSDLLVLREDLKSMDIVDSLARLQHRLEHEGLKNNVGDLVQKLRTGSGLEMSLVQQATEMRVLRAELAAQTAERLNVKFKIPVVLCAVACLLIFMAPAVVQMVESGLL